MFFAKRNTDSSHEQREEEKHCLVQCTHVRYVFVVFRVVVVICDGDCNSECGISPWH